MREFISQIVVTLKRILFIFFSFCLVGPLSAQKMVWVPDTTVCQNVAFQLPVFLSGFDERDSLIAYQLRLDYNPEFITIMDISNEGTLTETWDSPFYLISDSTIFIAGFSAYQKGFPDSQWAPSLLDINLSIDYDTSCTTSLRLSQVQFFNLEGILSIDSLKGSHIDVVYNVPPFISGFPDTTFFEDTSFKLSLQPYIHDLNDPIEDLNIDIHVPDPLTLLLDSTNWTIEITPPANWTGTFNVDVAVTDSFFVGDSDRFQIITLPIVDPPEPFHLISPPMDSTFSHFNSFIVFQWSESVNLDTGDVITYHFFLSPDSTFNSDDTIQMANISHSMLSIKPSFPDGIYYWRVRAEDQQGLRRWCDKIFRISVLTGISGSQNNPQKCYLGSPYPNPFNSQTVIQYELDQPMVVSLKLFDVRGREIRKLFQDVQSQGRHTVSWDGQDDQGANVPSGVYFIKMETRKYIKIRKISLIR